MEHDYSKQFAPNFAESSWPLQTDKFALYTCPGDNSQHYYELLISHDRKTRYIQTDEGLLFCLQNIKVSGMELQFLGFRTEQQVEAAKQAAIAAARPPQPEPDVFSIYGLQIRNGQVVPSEKSVPTRAAVEAEAFKIANEAARKNRR